MNIMLRTLLVATALSACAVSAHAQVIYHRGNTADPETLDTHKTSTIYEAHVLRDMLEGLVIHNAKAEIVPGVAEKWEISPDGLTYTFTLRANAKWSNGDAVKASDFVYSLRRIMNPETGAKYANILYAISNAEAISKGMEKDMAKLGVEAPNDRTLVIRLKSATPYFLELLTHQTALPVHPGSVEKFGKDYVRPENIVTNGAYVLKEFTPNAHIRLDKNPHFHDAANVRIDRVMFYPTKDTAAAVRRFQAGELHSNDDIPADQIKYLKQTFGDQVRLAPYLGTWYLAVNTTKTPLNDVRVRTALSMAIDREFIAEQIWGNTMVPGYSFVPPGIGNYGEPAYAPYKTQSIIEREDNAKALLKEAGFGPGKPLKIEIRYNMTDNNKNTVVAIAEQWKPLGVEVSFINTDAKTHFAHLREGQDFDLARAGWIGDYSDPQNFLFLVLSDNTGFNYAKYKNPEYDALMAKAAVESDLKKRAAILFQAETIFTRDLPYIPVMYYGSKNLVSPKLEGWHTNLKDVHPTRFLSLKP
ncbi:MAG: peptide ABC transporter substrate-binding protein [Beijerinckiaceae bacterium]